MVLDLKWLENEVFLLALNEGEHKILNEIFEIINFDVGDDIILQDSGEKEMFLIQSGTASVINTQHGKEILLGWVEKGAMIGNLSFFSGYPATATVRAMGAVRTYKMTHRAYCKLMTVHQGLLVNLLAYMQRYMAKVIHDSNMHLVSIVGDKGP